MKLIEKIKWRIELLFSKTRGGNLNVVIYNLLPARSPLAEKLIFNEVKKCPLIKMGMFGKNDFILNTGLMKLIYPKNLRMSHFAGDYACLIYPYLKKSPDEKISLLEFFPEHEGPYEKGGVDLRKGDWVIDAGANIGIFSIFAAKKVGGKGKIFSFEPISETGKLLKKNIELNGIENVKVVPFALGEKRKELNFSIFPESLECSSGFFDNKGAVEKVKQISLDEFVDEHKIPKVDFIKADLEGMEREFLIGAEATIKKFKPRIAICTYHRPGDPEILEKMIKDFYPGYKMAKDGKKLFAWN